MSDYIFAAKLADLTDDTILALDYEDAPIAITSKGNRFFAFGDVCTHDDGPLADGVIEPCNGSPAAAPIPIYKTKVMGDEVWVRVDEDDE